MNHRLVFTATNRPFYFRPVLDAWIAVRGFAGWRPLVFVEPTPVAAQMAALAAAAGAAVVRNPVRRGVLSNPWHALDHAFADGADFAVLAEDDVLVSDDVLEYFTWAAASFADAHLLTVCAASFAPACAPGHEQHTVRTKQFCPLVWGTWADRWTGVLRESWDHDYSSGTPQAPQSGWDWNINLRVMADWDALAPVASRSTHIGEHLGAHTTAATFPGSQAPTFRPHRPPAPFVAPSNR